jgi:HAD superfamily hydrolase (TIGR01459 family)
VIALPPIVAGVAAVADAYDGFVIDLWGVLHDGVAAYPGAVDALTRLRAAGRRIVLLSNSPGRRASVADRMAALGVGPDLYDALITSGETTYEALRDRPDAAHRALGRRVYLLGPPRDDAILADLPGIVRVRDPAAADFIVNTGADAPDETAELYDPVLDAGLARDLPMVCANPDLEVMVGDRMAICAGLIAQRYAVRGGRVIWHGKPHPGVYARCRAILGLPDDRVLAIGDTLRTDVAGAKAAGFAAALVTVGIHRDALGTHDGRPPEPARLAALLADATHRPDVVLPRFSW